MDEIHPFVLMKHAAYLIIYYNASLIIQGEDGYAYRVSSELVPLDDLTPVERTALLHDHSHNREEAEEHERFTEGELDDEEYPL